MPFLWQGHRLVERSHAAASRRRIAPTGVAMKFADDSLNAVVGFLYDLHRHSDLWTYHARLTELLARLIGCDSCIHVVLNRAAHTFELSSWPVGRFVFEDRRAAIALHGDHPLAVHHQRLRNLGAWRLSDVASKPQYHDSTVYRSLYRFLGIEHQMVMLLPAECNVSACSLCNARPRSLLMLNVACWS